MLIYFSILVFLILPLLFKQEQNNPWYDKYYWVEFLVLFLLMGLRFRVGGDSLRYEIYYKYAKDLQQLFGAGNFIYNGFQPLWNIYQAACRSITSDFVVVQLFNSFVVNGVIFYYANKYVEHRFTFVILYYFLLYPYFNTEIMRESLAVVLFLIGYKSLVERKYILYYTMCLIAFLFHASAIFLLALPMIYPILSKSRGWKSYVVMLVISALAAYFITPVLTWINSNLFMGNTLLINKSNGVLQSGSLNIFGITVKLLSMVPIFFCMDVYRKEEDESAMFVLNIYFVVSILGMIFLPLVRMANYFSILFLFIFSDVILDKEVIRKYGFIVSLSVFLLIYSRFSYYAQGMRSASGESKDFKMYQRYIPYHSIFDKEQDATREEAIRHQF